MAKDQEATTATQMRAQLVAVMHELDLPSPERMLGRIEKMLPERERERVLKQLLADFQGQSRDEIRRILKVLAPDREEWAREVDRMLAKSLPA